MSRNTTDNNNPNNSNNKRSHLEYLYAQSEGNPVLREMLNNTYNKNTDGNTEYEASFDNRTLDSRYNPPSKSDLWEATYGKELQVDRGSVGDIPDDLSEYTRLGVEYNPYQPLRSSDQRALNQPFGEQLTNAGKRFALSTIAETANTAGAILAVDDYFNADDEVGNAITQWASDFRKEIDEDNPIYIRSFKNNPGNYSWWLKNGADLASSVVSFGLTGGVIGRGLSSFKWLSKLTKGYRGVKRGADAAKINQGLGSGSRFLTAENIAAIEKGQQISNTLITSTLLNQAESLMSATQVYDDIYQEGLNKGFSDAKAREMASSAATYTMNVNRANIALNLTSAARFLKTPDAMKSALRVQSNKFKDIFKRKTADGKIIDSPIRDVVGESAQEALEEVINVYSETRGKEYAKSLFENSDDVRIGHMRGLFDTLQVDRLAQTALTKEGMEAAMLGALGGAGQTGVQYGIDRFGTGKLLGEQVVDTDEFGDPIREKRDLTYTKDTRYDVGEKVWEDIKNEEGETIIEKGSIVDEDLIAKHREFLVHKAGDKVRDQQGNVIQTEGAVKYKEDGKYFSKLQAREMRSERFQALRDRMSKIAEDTMQSYEDHKQHQKQYAAMDSVDAMLDPQRNRQQKEEYVDILARWELDNEGKSLDYESKEGKAALEAKKEELKTKSYDELMSIKNRAKSNLVKEQAWRALENNSVESLKSIYKDIANLSPEVAAEKGFDEEYKQQAESVINQIDLLSKYHKEYKAKYTPERARALYDKAAELDHEANMMRIAEAQKQSIIGENQALADQADDYVSTLDGAQRLEEINKQEEEKLKPHLKKLEDLDKEILNAKGGDARISPEVRKKITNDREYVSELAKVESEKARKLADLIQEYDQTQAQIDKIREEFAIKKDEEGLTSRADIESLVNINRIIRNIKSSIKTKNEEFIRIRDRKDDPRRREIIISEEQRQKNAFKVLAQRMYNLQEQGDYVVTFNPNKSVKPTDKYVGALFSRVSRVLNEADDRARLDLNEVIDEAIRQYTNILNDYEQQEFNDNASDIRKEVISKAKDTNLTGKEAHIVALEELSKLGFTGTLSPTESADIWDFKPNTEALLYTDESEVEYYRRAKFPRSEDLMYDVEEVKPGLYKVMNRNPDRTIELNYKDISRINLISKDQAEIKDLIDTHTAISRSRIARINVLEDFNNDIVAETIESIRDYNEQLNSVYNLDLGDEEYHMSQVKKEYEKKFGTYDGNLSTNQMQELNRLYDLHQKTLENNLMLEDLRKELENKRPSTPDSSVIEHLTGMAEDKQMQLLDKIRELDAEIDVIMEEIDLKKEMMSRLADYEEGLGFDSSSDIADTNSKILNLTDKIGDLQDFRNSLSDYINALDDYKERMKSFDTTIDPIDIEERLEMLKESSDFIKQEVDSITDVRNKLAKYRSKLLSGLSTEEERYAKSIITNLKNKYSAHSSAFKGYAPPNKHMLVSFAGAYDSLIDFLKEVSKNSGVVTSDDNESRMKVNDIVTSLSYIKDNAFTASELERTMTSLLEERDSIMQFVRENPNMNIEEFQEAHQDYSDLVSRINALKGMEFEITLSNMISPILDDMKNIQDKLSQAQEDESDINIHLTEDKIKIAKSYGDLRRVRKKMDKLIPLFDDYSKENQDLLNMTAKIDESNIIAAAADILSGVDEQTRQSLFDAGMELFDNEKRKSDLITVLAKHNELRSEMESSLIDQMNQVRSQSPLTQPLYLSGEEVGDIFIGSTREDVMNTKFSVAMKSIRDFNNKKREVERKKKEMQDLLEGLYNELDMIEKTKANISILTSLYGDTESEQYIKEIEETEALIKDLTSKVDRLNQAYDLLKKHGNLMLNINKSLDEVFTEDNIRDLYNAEELTRWETTRDINDLPSDPVMRLYEKFDESGLDIADIDPNQTYRDAVQEAMNNAEARRTESLNEKADQIPEVLNAYEGFDFNGDLVRFDFITNRDGSQKVRYYRAKPQTGNVFELLDPEITTFPAEDSRPIIDKLKDFGVDIDTVELVETNNNLPSKLRDEIEKKYEEDIKTAKEMAEDFESDPYTMSDIEQMHSQILDLIKEQRAPMMNQRAEYSTIVDMLRKAYDDIDDLIETEKRMMSLKNQEEVDEKFKQQLVDQKGADVTGDKNEYPIHIDDSDHDDHKRLYDEADTNLRRFSHLTDAGAHIKYTVDKSGNSPVYTDDYDENGMPQFVDNEQMIIWKTAVSKVQKGLMVDDNGEIINEDNTKVRFLTASNKLISNLKAKSNNLNNSSNAEFRSRGLAVNNDGEIYIANKTRLKQFLEDYPGKFVDGFEDQISSILDLGRDQTLTIGQLDLLFRYREMNKAYSTEVVEDKSTGNNYFVAGEGIYISFADSDGNLLRFNFDKNTVSNTNSLGYEVALSTLNTPLSGEKVQFLNNFAAMYSEQQGFEYAMTFNQLVSHFTEDANGNRIEDPSNINLDFETLHGDTMKVNLQDVIEMEDTLWVASSNDNPLKVAVRERVEDTIANFRQKVKTIQRANKDNTAVLASEYDISEGHVLMHRDFRALNDVFSQEEIQDIKINVSKKPGETKKRKSTWGSRVSFDVNPDAPGAPSYVPTPKSRTGRVLLLTKEGDYFEARPKKINEKDANLVLDIILGDFANYVPDLDSRFKFSTRAVDEDGNEINIPNAPLVRFESKRNMSSDDLPLISKLIYFSGKKADSEDRLPWDISVEKSTKGKWGNKNYLHYGENEVSIEALKRNRKGEQQKFKDWMKANLVHSINNKVLQEKKDSTYYHPVELKYDEDSSTYTTVYKKYDSYVQYLFDANVLETRAISRGESESIGGKGEINVNKYVEFNPEQISHKTVAEDKDVATDPPLDKVNKEETTLKDLSNVSIKDMKDGDSFAISYEYTDTKGVKHKINLPMHKRIAKVDDGNNIIDVPFFGVKEGLGTYQKYNKDGSLTDKVQGHEMIDIAEKSFNLFEVNPTAAPDSMFNILRKMLFMYGVQKADADLSFAFTLPSDNDMIKTEEQKHGTLNFKPVSITEYKKSEFEVEESITNNEFRTTRKQVDKSGGVMKIVNKEEIDKKFDTDIDVSEYATDDFIVLSETKKGDKYVSIDVKSMDTKFSETITLQAKPDVTEVIGEIYEGSDFNNVSNAGQLSRLINIAKTKKDLLDRLNKDWHKIPVKYDSAYQKYMKHVSTEKGGTIYMGTMIAEQSDAKIADILLHEIIHNETAHKIRKYKNRPSGTPGYISEALDDIDYIRGRVINELVQNEGVQVDKDGKIDRVWVNVLGPMAANSKVTDSIVATVKSLKESGKTITFDMFLKELQNNVNDSNIVDHIKSDIDEFVAAVFEDTSFQERLNNIEVSDSDPETGYKTLFEYIMKALRVMLDIEIKDNSALKKAVKASIYFAKEGDPVKINPDASRSNIISSGIPNPPQEGIEETTTEESPEDTAEDADADLDDEFDFGDFDDDPGDIGLEYPGDNNYPANDDAEESRSISPIAKQMLDDLASDDNIVMSFVESVSGTDRDSFIAYVQLASNGSMDSDTARNFVIDSVRSYVEAKQAGDDASISDIGGIMKGIGKEIDNAFDNNRDTNVIQKINSKSNLQIPVISMSQEKFKLNSDITLGTSEKLDLYEGISYYLFRQFIEQKIDIADNLSLDEMKAMYREAIHQAAKTMLDNATSIKNNSNLPTDTRNLAVLPIKVANAILENNYDSEFIIKDHFQNVMVSYGYHEVDSESNEEDNILDSIPDYVESYKLDPKILSPAIIKMMVAAIPNSGIKTRKISEESIKKFNAAISTLVSLQRRVVDNKDFTITPSERRMVNSIAKSLKLKANAGFLMKGDRKDATNLTSNEASIVTEVASQAIPILQARKSKGASITTTPIRNNMMLPSLVDYGRTWNFLARQMSNNPPTYDKLMDRLNKVINKETQKPKNRGIYGLKELKSFMKNFSDGSSAVDVSTQNALIQSLSKYEMLHTIVLVDTGGNIYETQANVDRKKSNVRSQWTRSATIAVSDFNASRGIQGNTISKRFIQHLDVVLNNSDKNPEVAAMNTLAQLGITFNDEAAAINTMKGRGVNNVREYVQQMISYMDKSIGKSPERLFDKSDDSIAGRIQFLIDIEVQNDTDIVTNQFINADGEIVYGLQMHHTFTLMNTMLNTYSTPRAREEHMPYLLDDYARSSRIIKHIDRGQQIKTAVVNGMRFVRSGEPGAGTNKLSVPDQLSLRITSVLEGTFLIPQAADRKPTNAIKIGENNDLLYSNKQDGINAFIEYFLDELRVMNNYTNNESYQALNSSDKAKNFRFFDEILSGTIGTRVRNEMKKVFVNNSTSDAIPSTLFQLSEYDKKNGTSFTKDLTQAIGVEFLGRQKNKLAEILRDQEVGQRTPKIKRKGKYVDRFEVETEGEKKTSETFPMFQGISKELFAKYSNNGTKDLEATMDALLDDYVMNQMGFYIEFTKIYSGDPVFFKTEDNFFKRMSMFNSTRKVASIGHILDNTLNKNNNASYKDETGVDKNLSRVAIRDASLKASGSIEDIDNSQITLNSGFRIDGKKHDSKFFSIVFEDVVSTSPFANDSVTAIKVKNGVITYFDKDNNEVEPSLYRRIFSEGLLKDGFTNPSVLNLKVEARLSKYKNIEEADAQGYITLDEYRELMIRIGDWTNKHERAYVDLLLGKQLSYEDMFYFQPLKTQYAGYMDMSNEKLKNAMVPVGYKHSLVPLIPSVIKGTNLQKLNEFMVNNQIGIAQFSSANKFGTKRDVLGKINKFYSDSGSKLEVDPSNWDSSLKQSTFYDFFAVQVDNKPKLKTEVTSGSQKRKLISLDIFDFGKPVSKEMAAANKEYIDLQNEIIRSKIDSLMRDLDVRKDSSSEGYYIRNYERLIELLMEQARSREADDNITSAIQMLNSKILRPNQLSKAKGLYIDEMPNYSSLENVLMALVNSKAIKEKRSGESFVQAASTGFEKERIKGSNDLKYYRRDVRNDNLIPAQVRIPLPKNLYKYASSIGGLKVFNKKIKDLQQTLEKMREQESENEIILTPEQENLKRITTVIGFRIPSQQLGSLGVFEVAEYLPPEVGNSAHVAPEIVAQMGSDMDFDKLNIEYPAVIMSESGPVFLDMNNIDVLSEYYRYMSKSISSGNNRQKLLKTAAFLKAKKEGSENFIFKIASNVNYINVKLKELQEKADFSTPDGIQEYRKSVDKLIEDTTVQIADEFGLDNEVVESMLELSTSQGRLPLSDVNNMLYERTGLLSGFTLDNILESLGEVKIESAKSLSNSLLYKAFVEQGGLSLEAFTNRINDKKKRGEYLSRDYMTNRMIELQSTLLLDKSRAHVFLSPVDDSPLIGDEEGVVWKVRFFTSPEASKQREDLMKKIEEEKEKRGEKSYDFRQYRKSAIKNAVKSFREQFKSKQEESSFFPIIDPVANILKAQAFLVGKDNIGISARQITNHTLTQAANAMMNLPIELRPDGNLANNLNMFINVNYVKEDGSPFDYDIYHLLSKKNRKYDPFTDEFMGITDKTGDDIILYPGERIYASLGGVKSKDNENILLTLSAMANSYLDVAKDPYIFDINAGSDTVNVFMYLLRLGATLEDTALLLNQDSVRKYIEEKNKYKSNFKKTYGLVPSKASMVMNVLSEYDSSIPKLYTTNEWYNLPKEDRVSEFVSMGFINVEEANKAADNYSKYLDYYNTTASKKVKLMAFRKQTHYNKLTSPANLEVDDAEIIRERNNSIHSSYYSANRKVAGVTMGPNDDVFTYNMMSTSMLEDEMLASKKSALNQKQALDMFLEYERQSQVLFSVMNATSQDTYGAAKSYSGTESYVNESSDVHAMEVVKNSKLMIDNTIVSGFDSVINETLSLYKRLYATKVLPIVDDRLLRLKDTFDKFTSSRKDKERAHAYLHEEFINFLLHTDFGDGKFVDTKKIYNKLIKGDESSRYRHPSTGEPISLPEFVNIVNRSSKETTDSVSKKLRSNSFFRKLRAIGNEEASDDIALTGRSVADQTDIPGLGIDRVTLTKPEKDRLISQFRDIKKIDENLYYDLINLSLAQHGISGGPHSYSSLIPIEDIAPLIAHKMNSLAKQHESIQDKFMNAYENQALVSYRAARFYPASQGYTTLTTDYGELRGPYVNIPFNAAPPFIVSYSTSKDGIKTRRISGSPSRMSNGRTIYLGHPYILGSNNWIGYNFSITNEFRDQVIADYNKAIDRQKISAKSEIAKQAPLRFTDDEKERIKNGDMTMAVVSKSFAINQNMSEGSKYVVDIDGDMYQMISQGFKSVDQVGGYEKALSNLGLSKASEVNFSHQKEWLSKSERHREALILDIKPVDRFEAPIYLYKGSVSLEDTPTSSDMNQLANFLTENEGLEIIYYAMPENLTDDQVNSILEKSEIDSLNIVELDSTNLDEYFANKQRVQSIYKKNASLAFDMNLGISIPDLSKHLENFYNYEKSEVVEPTSDPGFADPSSPYADMEREKLEDEAKKAIDNLKDESKDCNGDIT